MGVGQGALLRGVALGWGLEAEGGDCALEILLRWLMLVGLVGVLFLLVEVAWRVCEGLVLKVEV